MLRRAFLRQDVPEYAGAVGAGGEHRVEQFEKGWVGKVPKGLLRGGPLDDVPVREDGHGVAHVRHEAEVVGNKPDHFTEFRWGIGPGSCFLLSSSVEYFPEAFVHGLSSISGDARFRICFLDNLYLIFI